MKEMKKEMEEFEQSLENKSTWEAIVQYYKSNAREIGLGILGIFILIGLTHLPVWQRLLAIAVLWTVSYVYGRLR